MVRKIQAALSELGFYLGPVTGRMNPATEAAIRLYQERTGADTTGQPSYALLEHLQLVEEVKQLRLRLQDTRESQIASAREALASQSATRGLVADRTALEPADPSRDPSLCLAEPTVPCLLDEAVASAKAIHQVHFRDWVFGEIVVTQARAGRTDEALSTLRLVDDPRLIIAGLRNIVRAVADIGRLAEAHAVAATIPLSWSQAEALAAIAPAEIGAGDSQAARASIDRILELTKDSSETRRRVATLRALAVDLAQRDARQLSDTVIDRALMIAENEGDADKREALLSDVAAGLADLGRRDQASTLLARIRDPKHHPSILIAQVNAHIRSGDTAPALKSAQALGEDRYRILALGRIAVAQHRAGANAEALRTLDNALASTATIDARAAYARDYAISNVVQSYIAIAALDQASKVAARIGDPRLKADSLWSIVAALDRAGNGTGTASATAAAEQALDAIKSPYDQAWVLANLAQSLAAAGAEALARQLFGRAAKATQSITSPWARAQAVVKVAASLLAVSASDVSRKRAEAKP